MIERLPSQFLPVEVRQQIIKDVKNGVEPDNEYKTPTDEMPTAMQVAIREVWGSLIKTYANRVKRELSK